MTRSSSGLDRPLSGLHIVEAVDGPLAAITRYLAELGATVLRIAPAADAGSVEDFLLNRGKLAADDAPAVSAGLGRAHAVVAGPGTALDLPGLRAERPALVTMTVSDFGTDTSFSGWAATDAVLHALSGELSRSGVSGRPPLLPPGELAYQCAATQGAFVLASALYQSLRTGQGQHIDFSALDGAMQALDPGFGIAGSATMGRPASELSRDRPPPGFQYPILPCADGHVRLCLLAKRQWHGMFRWMGEPPAFAGPEFDKTSARYKSPDLLPAIAAFFAGRTRDDLEAEGQRYGVPLSAVRTLGEFVGSAHLRERQAVATATLPDGTQALLPNGVFVVDEQRLTPVAERGAEKEADRDWPAPVAEGAHAFEGLRVLDLGVIVVGGEQARLFADGGADVVKLESRAYPDGNRQSFLSYGLSVSFAAGHRNKRSLGLNLRDAAGKALFLKLAEKADILLSNFKPGTLASLGLDNAALMAANPRLILVDSSAFGATGPWSGRMGYGPLVRATSGLTQAWRYPADAGSPENNSGNNSGDSFCDSVTVYPDHTSARIGALAAVALLIRRLRTGRGGAASLSQAEVMLAHYAAYVAKAGQGRAIGQPADWPRSVYRADGDDDWCVVDVRGTADWRRLAAVVGFPNPQALDSPAARLAARSAIDAVIAGWIAARSAQAAMEALQAAGVPAARMLRVSDLPSFAYYRERGFFRTETHPYLVPEVTSERRATTSSLWPDAPMRPAPLLGEHSAEVIGDWLPPSENIEDLIEAGVLEPTDDETLTAAIARVLPPRNPAPAQPSEKPKGALVRR